MTKLISTHGLIGYDCANGNSNITHISLRNIGSCDLPDLSINTTTTYLQLLQVDDYKTVHVYQCKIEIKRSAFYCGMHSHISLVSKSHAEYLLDIDAAGCQKIQETGRVIIGNEIIDGLIKNYTETRSINIAGKIKSNGECKGVPYSDAFGSFDDNTVVQGVVTITLRDYLAPLDLDNNLLHLKEGVTCAFNRGSCSDYEGGQIFWERVPMDQCQFNKYTVLYEGPATIGKIKNEDISQIIYTVQTPEITFALAKEMTHTKCGYQLIQTEHPKLFILEGSKGTFFATKQSISPKQMDLFAYVNSKFVYVEKHLHTQMNDLYKDILTQRCLLEQKVLRNSLSLASIEPDLFALNYMQGPGFLSVIGGEIIYIIKCIAVNVKLRKTEECYQELPVKKGEEDYFLTPRTRILKKTGLQINCNPILPSMYEIDGTWYRFLPQATETKSPHQLKPNVKPTWEYKSIGNLATNGIYSKEDLDKLREDVMFPANRPAILNVLARRVTGQKANSDYVSLNGLFDTEVLEKLTTSAWNKFWNKFTMYGNISAGIIMTFLIWKFGKSILSTLMNMFAIHSVFGCNVRLLGAFWSTLTNFWIHRRYHQDNQQNVRQEERQREERQPERRQPEERQPEEKNNDNIERENVIPLPLAPEPDYLDYWTRQKIQRELLEKLKAKFNEENHREEPQLVAPPKYPDLGLKS